MTTHRVMSRATRSLKVLVAVGGALLAWGLLLVYTSSPAQAATITVNSTADAADPTDGACTLREAITSANSDAPSGTAAGECATGSGDDIISFALPGTAPWMVNLTKALPDLSSNIEIQGPGANRLKVRRATGGHYSIFQVDPFNTASISGITISGGNTFGEGGGISIIRSDLTITDSTVSGNAADFSGGGIYVEEGTVTITDSTIRGNAADLNGGGITNSGGVLTVSGSTVSGNTAQNGGGGIVSNTDLAGETTTITNSTVSGNTATDEGGGIYNIDGRTVVEHSTVTDNTAPDGQGSGMASFGDTDTRTEVLSSIVSANTNTDADFLTNPFGDTTNSFVSNGYNLVGTGNATAAFDQTGDQTGVADPGLDPLGSYGGPTQTHRLQPDSPAVDAGPPTDGDPVACPPPATDQRGVQRPQDGDADGTATCDVGSFELDTPANQAPTVTVDRGGECGPASDMRGTINLALSDPDTPPREITLSATSSDRTVVPEKNLLFGGGKDASRTLTVTAVKGGGTSTLRVRASDGELQSPPLLVVVVSGTSTHDALSGTANADMVFARKGADALGGRGANDLLCGGNGKDRLTGGGGADHFGGGYGTKDAATDFDAGEGDTRRGIERF